MPNHAHFRFYAALNDFLSSTERQQTLCYAFNGTPSVKDCIEALGIPHVEVAMVLHNGTPVDFTSPVKNGDFVSVFPAFFQIDRQSLAGLQPPLPENACFVLDVHLGKLACKLRMLGFDSLYSNDYPDAEIVQKAAQEQRIVLTRDRGILKNKQVLYGYCLRSNQVEDQVAEVLDYFDLYDKVHPFQRCIRCNGKLMPVDKEHVKAVLQPRTLKYYTQFYACTVCGKVYWPGSHYQKM